MLIETAYFACIPPEDGRRYKAKELPPMQLYIRQLEICLKIYPWFFQKPDPKHQLEIGERNHSVLEKNRLGWSKSEG